MQGVEKMGVAVQVDLLVYAFRSHSLTINMVSQNSITMCTINFCTMFKDIYLYFLIIVVDRKQQVVYFGQVKHLTWWNNITVTEHQRKGVQLL